MGKTKSFQLKVYVFIYIKQRAHSLIYSYKFIFRLVEWWRRKEGGSGERVKGAMHWLCRESGYLFWGQEFRKWNLLIADIIEKRKWFCICDAVSDCAPERDSAVRNKRTEDRGLSGGLLTFRVPPWGRSYHWTACKPPEQPSRWSLGARG